MGPRVRRALVSRDTQTPLCLSTSSLPQENLRWLSLGLSRHMVGGGGRYVSEHERRGTGQARPGSSAVRSHVLQQQNAGSYVRADT